MELLPFTRPSIDEATIAAIAAAWSGAGFDATVAARRHEADEFYAAIASAGIDDERMRVLRQASAELKRFLFQALYRHAQVQQSTERARQVVHELFVAYVQQPDQMPPEHAAQPQRERAVADYIAGMTDRFALREHQRLTGRVLFADAT